MVICRDINNIILWIHSDNRIKQLDEYKNLSEIFVIDKEVLFKEVPDDGYKYNQVWDELSQDIVLERLELEEYEVIKCTYSQIQLNSEDNLINMELNTDINTKVTLTGEDSLLLMEMLLTIDEKIDQLL